MTKRVIEQPALAPREVVERTMQYLASNQYRLPLIEWVATPAGGFWQGAEYRFVPDDLTGRVCWRVDKRRARSEEWVYLFHAPTIERAIARLWETGCGWWRPHRLYRLWRLEVGIHEAEALSEPVEW